jgi:hypothetical protein
LPLLLLLQWQRERERVPDDSEASFDDAFAHQLRPPSAPCVVGRSSSLAEG